MGRHPTRVTNVVEPGRSLLIVDGVSSGYGDSLAVQGATLTVRTGECVGVLGPNGAGKTSLLRTVSGTVGVLGGQITFAGHDVTGMAPHRLASLGVAHVPEGRCIYPGLTVEENLRVGLFARADRRRRTGPLEDAYELFSWMRDRRRQMGFSLSGGEQQMLAIARGMISDPLLLILDEPSLGVSPKLVDLIFETLHAVRRRGVSILVVEQSADRLLDLADRAYVMNRGSMVLEGTATELRADTSVYDAYLA